eukprot:scaffold228350_cov28-Tisochrysis_lutea.AAC.1
MASGIMPGSSCVPSMVCVLPLPVCPYAKMHTLWPSKALCVGAQVQKRVACKNGPHARLNTPLRWRTDMKADRV